MTRIEVPIDALPVGRPVRLDCGNVGIVVVRSQGGDVHAFRDLCPHARWRLSQGDVVDGKLECPGHGMQFELATGRCADVDSYCLEPVPVTVRDSRVELMVPEEPTSHGVEA